MASTQEILTSAKELGKLIATHEKAKKLEDAIKKLQGDVEAQRALNDYNRHLTKLGEKEQSGQPIEVTEKRELEKLQGAVMQNPTLRDFQMAQMDYLDLMRKVDEAIEAPMTGGEAPGGGGAGGAEGAAPVMGFGQTEPPKA